MFFGANHSLTLTPYETIEKSMRELGMEGCRYCLAGEHPHSKHWQDQAQTSSVSPLVLQGIEMGFLEHSNGGLVFDFQMYTCCEIVSVTLLGKTRLVPILGCSAQLRRWMKLVFRNH
jgi:hypothetical protein